MTINIVNNDPNCNQYNYYSAFICGGIRPDCLVTLIGEQAVRDWLKENFYNPNAPLVTWDAIRPVMPQ